MGSIATRPARRLEALDGLRGLAALMVVLFHLESVFGLRIAPEGDLMVDLFFLISGFVLAQTYGERLARGGQGLWFLRIRLLRLYPMTLAGIALGAIFWSMMAAYVPSHALPSPIALFVAPELVFMPQLRGDSSAFPIDGPLWSLMLEIVMGCAYGFFASWLSTRRLAVLVGLSAVVLVSLSLDHGSLDLGSRVPTLPGGFARIGFSFPLGVILQRVLKTRSGDSRRGSPWVLSALAMVVAVSLCRMSLGWEWLTVFLVFPGLVLVCARSEPPAGLSGWFAWASRLSFPLYALHLPTLLLVRLFGGTLGGALDRWAVAGLAVVIALIVAWAAERWIDQPVRRLILAHRARLALA
jgi:peptidoglycan/LPS O-acetylase OafA/YrhL